MGLGDIAGASRPSGRLLLASLLIWAILAVALPLSALTLNVFHFGGFPLGFWVAAQGAIIGLVALVAIYAWRAGGTPVREGIGPALVFAGEIVGAVGLLGFTGYIAAMGYDGLALPLGMVAGVALLAILVAPRFVLYPVQSISGFFAVRYGGSLTRRLAFLIASAATALLLAADIRAGSLALQSLTEHRATAGDPGSRIDHRRHLVSRDIAGSEKDQRSRIHRHRRRLARHFDRHRILRQRLFDAASDSRHSPAEPRHPQPDTRHQSSLRREIPDADDLAVPAAVDAKFCGTSPCRGARRRCGTASSRTPRLAIGGRTRRRGEAHCGRTRRRCNPHRQSTSSRRL